MTKRNWPCSVEGCQSRELAKGLCQFHYDRQRFNRVLTNPPKTTRNDINTFLRAVFSSDTDECITWPFAVSSYGYGKWQNPDGRSHNVANHICEVVHGPAPGPEYETAHSCGKGHLACVNPRHVSWKTHLGNTHDKYRHGTHAQGEDSPLSVLTETEVREIHALAMAGAHHGDISDRYGISRSHVSSIKGGYRWGHLKL